MLPIPKLHPDSIEAFMIVAESMRDIDGKKILIGPTDYMSADMLAQLAQLAMRPTEPEEEDRVEAARAQYPEWSRIKNSIMSINAVVFEAELVRSMRPADDLEDPGPR